MWSTTPKRGCVAACERRSSAASAARERVTAVCASDSGLRLRSVKLVRWYGWSTNTLAKAVAAVVVAATDSSLESNSAFLPSLMYTLHAVKMEFRFDERTW